MSTIHIEKPVIPAIIVGVTGFFRRLNGAALTRLLTQADVGKRFLVGGDAQIVDMARLVAC